MTNPLIDDTDIDFVLHDVVGVKDLPDLPYFADHSSETFEGIIDAVRRMARELLWPGYKELDEHPPVFTGDHIEANKALKPMLEQLFGMGWANAARSYDVGGQQVPLTVMTAASAYLMAANLSAYGYIGLTSGAAHLVEAFGSEEVKGLFLDRMYAGEWTGTMALTEPEAGSSLGDLTTAATPREDGTYLIRGSKIFISGGDHDLADNIVHLCLGRIDGAAKGTKGISLFAVPKRRMDADGNLVDNDVVVTGNIRKIGWKGLPSLALQFGEQGDCVGWLVGEPGRGLAHMFQMMNEARLMVGVNGAATASVAYQEALAYARERTQGRVPGNATADQVPLVTHADVRRMLVRQKAIVDGSLTLLVFTGRQADLAEHAPDEATRKRAKLLLDLLTPIAKSFPAEAGFEANALAVQVHGGYGYSSEYLPEAFLRDQKLNSIHEGTTGIQAIDLLGRRAMAGGGEAMQVLLEEVEETVRSAESAGVDPAWGKTLSAAFGDLAALTAELGAVGAKGEAERMLRHATDYLMASSTLVIAWQHLARAAAAERALQVGTGDPDHLRGVRATTAYWFATDVAEVGAVIDRIRSGEDSFASFDPAWF